MYNGTTVRDGNDAVIGMLQAGAEGCECGMRLSRMDSLRRCDLYTGLVMERLKRKSGEVKALYDANEKDWNQTLYVMLFRAMGGANNRQPYIKLAGKVRYNMCLRERSSLVAVESMLLGTAGLLPAENSDEYVARLRQEYDYLRNKYRIGDALQAGEWEMRRITPANAPVLRIAQLAALAASKESLFDNMLMCHTKEDVYGLLDASASDYWTTHYGLSGRGATMPKRLGHAKKEILGINVVVPVMFAYADEAGNEKLKMQAVELLENIPAEQNMIVGRWTGNGAYVASAFDTQALLQLNNEYCAARQCGVCPLGRRVISACSTGGE